jgi:hypothetical protein
VREVRPRPPLPAVSRIQATDAEIFFLALLGMASVLLAGVGLETFIAQSNVRGPGLIARVAPVAWVQPIYVFFILLPTALAVLTIGVPFFLRTLVAAIRRTLGLEPALGLVSLVACAGLLVWELREGQKGLATLTAVAAVAVWQSWRWLAAPGRAVGARLVGTAGLALVGLVYYENAILRGGATSMAIAPTLAVVGFFCAALGVPLMLVRAFGRAVPGSRGRLAAATALIGAALWCAAPFGRNFNSEPGAGDRYELLGTLAAAVLFVAIAVLSEIARRGFAEARPGAMR